MRVVKLICRCLRSIVAFSVVTAGIAVMELSNTGTDLGWG